MKSRIVRSAIVIAAFFLFPWAEGASGSDGVPISLIGVRDGMYTVCVDKSLQCLYVYNGRKQIKTIPCSTGMNPGDKKAQGDLRTPEGIYFFEKIIEGQNLPEYYGWRAYTLNYPNALDRVKGKNGNGIWIHGRMLPLQSRDTKGCVSLTNSDLMGLDPYLSPYHTPIITFESIITIDEKSLDEMKALYRDFISAWINAWQDKDFETYMSCYSPRFTDTLRGQELDDYLARKKEISSRYEFISIFTHGLTIVGTDSYVLCYFLIDYSGDVFQSSGVKYVYLENGSEGPKILAEEFIPLQKAPQWLTAAEEMRKQQEGAVHAFLDSWRTSWEKKDLNSMKDLYLPSFPDRENYFAAKAKNLAPYQSVSVVLDDVAIRRTGVYWTVTAKQRFISEAYEDFGLKTLKLVNTSQGFRAVQELWEKIDENS